MGLTFVLLMVANLLIELSVLMVVRGLWKDQRMGRLLLTCVTVNLVSYPLAYLCMKKTGYPMEPPKLSSSSLRACSTA